MIAELKLRSPSQGALSSADSDIGRRVSVYAAAGAVAVSVLTEPERFEGSLEHLQEAALYRILIWSACLSESLLSDI